MCLDLACPFHSVLLSVSWGPSVLLSPVFSCFLGVCFAGWVVGCGCCLWIVYLLYAWLGAFVLSDCLLKKK